MHAQPALERVALNLAVGLVDGDGDADAHQLLKAADVRHQIGIQVVAVERRPEARVVGDFEQVAQHVQLLDCLVQGRVPGGRVRCRGRERREDVGGEKGEAEAEVGRGEDGEGLDEDVCDCFVFGGVRVELVSRFGAGEAQAVSK